MYNVVSTLAPSFLIGSSSYLQVMRTSITSRTSSKFDLATDGIIMEKTVLQLFLDCFCMQSFSYLQVLQLVSHWDATNSRLVGDNGLRY